MNSQQRIESSALRTTVLIVATMTSGLTAGVFVDWSTTIMPGLSDVDDRTFVESLHELDAAIFNPLLMGVVFTGSLLSTGLALLLSLRPEQRKVLIWVGVALAAHLLMWMITVGVHEPLNQEVRTPGRLDSDADYAAVRAAFDESMWAAWNTVRALVATVAVGCLAWALVIHRGVGRSSADGRAGDWARSSLDTPPSP